MQNMRPIYSIWIEDVPKYIDTLIYNLTPDFEDLGIEFCKPDLHLSESFLPDVARAIEVDIVMVDYNLPGGINGDSVIQSIRQYEHNNKTPIIFYSSNLDSADLKKLVIGLPNIICCHRDSLGDELIRILKSI